MAAHWGQWKSNVVFGTQLVTELKLFPTSPNPLPALLLASPAGALFTCPLTGHWAALTLSSVSVTAGRTDAVGKLTERNKRDWTNQSCYPPQYHLNSLTSSYPSVALPPFISFNFLSGPFLSWSLSLHQTLSYTVSCITWPQASLQRAWGLIWYWARLRLASEKSLSRTLVWKVFQQISDEKKEKLNSWKIKTWNNEDSLEAERGRLNWSAVLKSKSKIILLIWGEGWNVSDRVRYFDVNFGQCQNY